MSISKFTNNVNVVQGLPDVPSMSADELKAKFDEGANAIKLYLNQVLSEEIDNAITNLEKKISAKLDRSSGGTMVGELTTEGGLVINSRGTSNGIELFGDTPYMDFHFGNRTQDYTVRIIEDRLGHLHFLAPEGVSFPFEPNAMNFGSGSYASADYWFVKNAHNGHPIVLTWQDSGKLELSVDSHSQGYISLTTTSDKRLKEDVNAIDDRVLDAIGEVELKQFRVTRNNPNGKISFGVIAQELIEAFEKHDLKVEDYNLIDTIEYEEGTPYYIVNYEQFMILRQASLERKFK